MSIRIFQMNWKITKKYYRNRLKFAKLDDERTLYFWNVRIMKYRNQEQISKFCNRSKTLSIKIFSTVQLGPNFFWLDFAEALDSSNARLQPLPHYLFAHIPQSFPQMFIQSYIRRLARKAVIDIDSGSSAHFRCCGRKHCRTSCLLKRLWEWPNDSEE